ncbi:hypothetical protein BJ741DRAFT_651747 [Chytriomyces cf. hyalinus JEL632]|nr:hypothetical protein BJ741DRAFT_651747 [Chytriomyces cf. hyalinus JEL632]
MWKTVRRPAIPEMLTFIGGCIIGYTSSWFYIGDPTGGGCKARVVLVALAEVSGKAYRNSKALKNMLVTAWFMTSKMHTIEMETEEFTYTQCIEIITTTDTGSTIRVLMQALHVLLFTLLLYTLSQHKHIKSESAQDHLTTLVLTAQTLVICIVIVQGLAGTNSTTNVETDPHAAMCVWKHTRQSSIAVIPTQRLYQSRLINFTTENCIVRFAAVRGWGCWSWMGVDVRVFGVVKVFCRLNVEM